MGLDFSGGGGGSSIATPVSIANGGTNSAAALNNNRIIKSSGGAIVEAAAITASRALISDANGIPVHSAVTSTTLGYLDVGSSLTTLLAAKAPTLAQHEHWVRKGKNWASAGTKIRCFDTVKQAVGTSITYTADTTNGDKWTINDTGLYGIYYNDTHTSSANFGVSRNASDLTANIYDLVNVADEMLMYATCQAASAQVAMGGCVWLTAGDIIRAHGEGLGGTNPHVMFKITRIY